VPGFHFYVLNQAKPTLDLLQALGMKTPAPELTAA
jgi:5,10-methylenetetrahydrofolate reductase